MKGVIIHTNGQAGRTIEDIDRYHRSKGWNGCGYHEVIHEDGSRHRGRADGQIGAHTKGLNDWYGICYIGDGSKPSTIQTLTLWGAAADALRRFNVSLLIGHREAGHHGGEPTSKSCPGSEFDMNAFRAEVFNLLSAKPEPCPACHGTGLSLEPALRV